MSKTQTTLERRKNWLATKTVLGDKQQGHYRMYWHHAQASAYSSKLRGYLNYKEIPYKLMPATLEDYQQIIPKLVGMPILPVVLTPDDRVMQDSTPMMEWFEKEYPEKSAVPDDERLAWVMWLIEEFADEYMPRIIMRTRWGAGYEANQRTLSARLARGFSYGESTEVARTAAEFILGRQTGFATALAFKTEEDLESIDQQLLDLLKMLDSHLAEHAYLLGDRPSLADFAFFGGMWCHCFKDPCSAELLELNAPQVCNWLEEMEYLGDSRGCLGREEFGDWLDVEEGLPDTIIQLIGFVAQTYLPQAQGYRSAMLSGEKGFTADIYGVETRLPRFDYRAGTFAQLQQRYADLAEKDQDWLYGELAVTGLLPSLMEGGIHPSPEFAGLTAPFVTDPAQNQRSYSRTAKEGRQ